MGVTKGSEVHQLDHINVGRRWEKKTWQHAGKQAVGQQDESDRSGGVCEKSPARFLCGDSRIGLPSPLQRGEEPGAHRRLPVLREEVRFPQLAGKVRKDRNAHPNVYSFIYAFICASNEYETLSVLLLATEKWKCTTCGNTAARGRVCCPRRSICWFQPAKNNPQWATKRQPENSAVSVSLHTSCHLTVITHSTKSWQWWKQLRMLQLWAAGWHSWLMQASRFGWSSHYSESLLLTPCFCANSLLFWLFYSFLMNFQWWSSMWCASMATSRSPSGSWREAWMGPSLLLLEKATEWMWAGLHGASVARASFIQNHYMLPFPSFQIDLTEEMESWAAKNLISDDLMKVKPVWRDASFTLKYYSDALFDFPHWLGFSKRIFKVRL